jgi:hypothetical protein
MTGLAISTRTLVRCPTASTARRLVEKGVEGSNSPVLEARNVHPRDNRRSSSRSEFPLQAAEIVVHLRRRRLRKHEVRSTLEKALDLCVKSVAANDPLLRFKERAVRGVNLRYIATARRVESRCPNTSIRFFSIKTPRVLLMTGLPFQ